MKKNGYINGKNLFGLAFDWRKSVTELIYPFLDRVEEVFQSAGRERITIITHSAGSLIARTAFALNPDYFSDRVKNWICIASAFQGTSRLLDCWLRGSLFNDFIF